MPKKYRTVPDPVRHDVIHDYIHSFLTLYQIAEKHHVSLRFIHACVDGKFHRNNSPSPERLSLRLTKQEAETLLLCICEADYVIGDDYKIISRMLEQRLLDIADKLTPTGYVTHEEPTDPAPGNHCVQSNNTL